MGDNIISALGATFSLYDANGDASLDKSELFELMQHVSEGEDESTIRGEVDQIFNECDSDKNGKLSYTEVLAALRKKDQGEGQQKLRKLTFYIALQKKDREKVVNSNTESFRAHLSSFKERAEVEERKRKEAEDKLHKQQALLEEKEETERRLLAEKRDLQEKLAAANQSSGDNEKLQDDNEEYKKIAGQLEEKVKATQEENIKLNKELRDLRAEISRLKEIEKTASIKKSVTALEADDEPTQTKNLLIERSGLLNQISILSGGNDSLKNEKRALTSDLEALRQSYSALETKIADLESTIVQNGQEIADLRKDKNKAEQEAASIFIKYQELVENARAQSRENLRGGELMLSKVELELSGKLVPGETPKEAYAKIESYQRKVQWNEAKLRESKQIIKKTIIIWSLVVTVIAIVVLYLDFPPTLYFTS